MCSIKNSCNGTHNCIHLLWVNSKVVNEGDHQLSMAIGDSPVDYLHSRLQPFIHQQS